MSSFSHYHQDFYHSIEKGIQDKGSANCDQKGDQAKNMFINKYIDETFFMYFDINNQNGDRMDQYLS